MPSETDADQSSFRRLGVKVEAAFAMACDQRDQPVAELLFECLELLTRRDDDGDDEAGATGRQAQLDALVDAQVRLDELKTG